MKLRLSPQRRVKLWPSDNPCTLINTGRRPPFVFLLTRIQPLNARFAHIKAIRLLDAQNTASPHLQMIAVHISQLLKLDNITRFKELRGH
jgi:hypothetical protein